ncbi:hypothetical protein GCM10014719_50050 [Planomonospora parontospora subsp. antibiotica]|nr:hypothetical protein GCM10014719_50050 [Planomonospora parontospora subsp. antibiotica]GII18356.1 hypothetical protein Ppa05_50820 [Planomonospora parontospora subsp. antibiotica]
MCPLEELAACGDIRKLKSGSGLRRNRLPPDPEGSNLRTEGSPLKCENGTSYYAESSVLRTFHSQST